MNHTHRLATIVLAGVILAVATPAFAEEAPPPKPSAQDLAVLRGLLGVKPAVQPPAAPAPNVTAPSAEATNPAAPAPASPLPRATTSAVPAANALTSENVVVPAGSDVSRAIHAARAASRELLAADRPPPKDL